jgi:hypothetical protein
VNYCDVNVLVGKTLSKIHGGVIGEDVITFTTSDGEMYSMFHYQDCCESVSIHDIVGDMQDLVGEPLLVAEEVSGETPAGWEDECHDSHTWTFYKFATRKGYVDIRWLGESNGYYSESVTFCKV